jgi:tetratricopeptide (TPR) repeat protein
MKRIALVLFLIVFVSNKTTAQNNETAFSKSYQFEYDAQYAKAIKALTDLNTDSYEFNLRLGWLCYLSKEYTRSEAYYKKAIAQEASSIEARFGIVLPMAAESKWSNVLLTYFEVVKIDPNNSVANYRIATIFYNKKDYPNAVTYVTKVIKLYPFDFDSNLLYGKVLMAQGKNAEAKKELEKALKSNPLSDEVKTLLKKL